MSDSKETIINRLLSDIDDSYDKNKGTVFYDAEMPVAIELETAYKTIEKLPDEAMPDTATGKDLDRVVKAFVERKTSTKSTGIVTLTGIAGSNINKGDLVSSDTVNFYFYENSIIPSSGTIDVKVVCVNYGIAGNIIAGAIKYFPKTLKGLQTVTNKEAFTDGYDEETDDELRERYYLKVKNIVNSSNKNSYRNWALEITGTGDARVIPIWNGPGTVKVIIINANKTGADETLVNTVQDYIDPNKNGDGSGTAPCGGGVCTVVSAAEKSINIKCKIDSTLSDEVARKAITNDITNYLKKIAFDDEIKYVSYAKVGSEIISISGINDYSDLTINNGTSNIDINDDEVAVFGGVTFG
jgi:uncharacterized phage protein gp47/JayE